MGLTKKLFAHGGIYVAANLLERAAGFLLVPLYAHVVGAEGFGIIQLMATLASAATVMFAQGQPATWLRLRYGQPEEAVRTMEATVIWYLAASSLALVAVLWTLGAPLARRIAPGVPFHPFVVLAILIAAFEVWSRLAHASLQVQERPLALGVLRLARTGLTVVLALLFVVTFSRGAQGKLEADALSGAVFVVVALVLIRPESPRRFSKKALKRCLAYGLPILPHALAMLLNDAVDRVLIGATLGLSAVGIYGVAYKFGTLGILVGAELNRAYTPLFMRTMTDAEAARAQGDDARASRLRESLAEPALMLMTLSCCIALCVASSAREVIIFITPADFHDAWRVLPLVALGAIAWTAYSPFSQAVLYDPRAARRISVISILAACTNVAGNLLLLPRVGLIGAAWATLLSNLVMCSVAGWMAQRSVPVPHRWSRWTLVVGWTVVNVVGYWLLDEHVDDTATRLAAKLAWLPFAVVGVLVASGERRAILQLLLVRLRRR